MGLGKTYSADYLIDSNGNTGVSGQVLISTATGIDWADGSAITGGPFLPLAGGTLTGNLTISNASPALNLTDTDNASNISFSSVGGALIVNSSSDQVYQIAGAEKMRINSSGNVGIGCTPDQKLHVKGTIETQATNSTNGWQLYTYTDNTFRINYNGAGSDELIIDSSGNVGIGTTSPNQKLQVGGNLHVYDEEGNTDSSIFLSTGTSDVTTVKIASNGDSFFNAGNVGIGTTAPVQTLEIHDPNASGYTHFGIKGTGHKYVIGVGNDSVATVNDKLYFYDNDNSAFRAVLDTSGNFGIGTTSPSEMLEIKPGSGGDSKINMLDSAGAQKALIGYDNGNGGLINLYNQAGTRNVVVRGYGNSYFNGGNVGIGTTSPSAGAKLEVIGKGDQLGSTGFYVNSSFKDDNNVGVFICHDDTVNTTGAIAGINQLSFITYGSSWEERMKITGAGNVGIGTTSPSSKLQVSGDAYVTEQFGQGVAIANKIAAYGGEFRASGASAQIFFGRSGSSVGSGAIGADSTYVFRVWTTPGFGNPFVIKQDGNVGIGTTSPTATLNVKNSSATALPATSGTTQSASALRVDNGNVVLDFGSHSSNGASWIQSSLVSNLATTFPISLNPNGGNVGIGTTSPAAKLDVNGDIAVKGASIINKASAALTIGDIAGNDSVTNLTLTTAGRSTEVFLDDSGNVGVNTATPSYNLTVDSGANDIGIVTASSDSGSYVGFLDNATSTIPKVGAVGNKLILDASQYVGVRKTNPSYALDVNGTIRATGNVIAYSDARVKENVETIPNALDKVKAMRGVGYNKIGEEKRSIGVIAQEMLEVMPEVVSQDEQGMYSVAYGNLVGVLIEAVKEQQQQIDELKKQIK